MHNNRQNLLLSNINVLQHAPPQLFPSLGYTYYNAYLSYDIRFWSNITPCIKIKIQLGDNCIQNFHMGRYIVGYTVRNLVLVENGYPHSNVLLQFELKLERCKPHKASHHPTKYDIINDVKLFPTVYRWILLQILYVIQSDVALQTQVH